MRCARCKHEWHEKLPSNIDVVMPPQDFAPIPAAFSSRPSLGGHGINNADEASKPSPVANLPAVIKKRHWPKKMARIAAYAAIAAILAASPIFARQVIIKALPSTRMAYRTVGLQVPPVWDGLQFDNVKSELKYDSGAMKLSVDGMIHNSAERTLAIPDIKAHALGPDKSIIESWLIEAPGTTIAAGGEAPFHTEVATSMEHTIEDVYLEFTSREEKGDAVNK